ncbi:MAG: AMP-binding protein [Acidimicrobiales bacterium]
MPNFASIWEGVADAVPDAVAAAHGFDSHSWREFEDRSARLAAAIDAAGIGHDDKVGLYLFNGFEYEEAQFAAFKQRAVPCNVNYRYLADELAYLLTNADAKALFFDVTLADRVAEVRDRCPDLQLMIQVGGGELLDGAVHYDDLLANHEPAPRIERSGDDLWFLYTGGTTGNPKAVMWPHAELQKSAEAFYRPLGQPVPTTVEAAVAAAVELHDRNRTTRVLAGAPLMHGTSGIVSLQVLMTGGAVATLPTRSFDAKELWEVVAHHRLTMLAIVGEAFSRPMLEELDRAKAAGQPHDLSSLFQIMSSGVMWSKESKTRFLEHKKLTLLDTLGSSESPGQGSQLTKGDAEQAKTATFELGDTTVVITDDGRIVEPGSGERGRLANRGVVPLGYFKDDKKTAETFPTINGVRYSIPGDYATVETDGTITLLGRGSVSINSGGEKIYPEEVEEALKSHPDVIDCNVVGLPDERWGQTVNAVLSLEDGAEISDDDLIAHARTRIAAYKTPKRILRVESVLRGPNGKADYTWAKKTAEEITGIS